MFAFFGLGIAELIILLMVGLALIAIPVFIVMVLTATKQAGRTARQEEIDHLRAENERLREKLDRAKDHGDGEAPSDGIRADH